MPADAVAPPASRTMLIAGWILGIIPALMLLMSGVMKLMKTPQLAEGFEHLGYNIDIAVPLGIVELACTALYLIPRTSMLGAILLTGYLGGAIATHMRIGEQFLLQIGMGVLLWLGLFLRDARLRALLPLKS